jgi:hypothetical protein
VLGNNGKNTVYIGAVPHVNVMLTFFKRSAATLPLSVLLLLMSQLIIALSLTILNFPSFSSCLALEN